MFDITIIGAGVVGSFIARELSKYQLKVAVLEKENDVGNVTSSANSAIVHSGYDPLPNTLKAKLNKIGNMMFDEIAKELDVPFSRIGSLTIALDDEQLKALNLLKKRSEENGVQTEIISREKVIEMEPSINKEIKAALYAPTCGIIDPFLLTIHAMENAVNNGVTLLLNTDVIDIKYKNNYFDIVTNNSIIQSKIIINAAGLASDKIASMIEEIDWKITPKKGEYFVLGNNVFDVCSHVIFPMPSEKGKGILVTPTTSGNYLVGPSSEIVEEIDDFATDSLTLNNVAMQAKNLFPDLPISISIRNFAGLRPSTNRNDFIIEPSKKYSTFINVAGIDSPGLVSSPAIAQYVVNNILIKIIELKSNPTFNPFIKKYVNLKALSNEEKNDIIRQNPEYGEKICFCEDVSLGEILETLNRSVPPVSIKGIKRRTRAGFGLCQGGFCSSKVALILAKHYHLSLDEILYDQIDSNVVKGKSK